MAWPKGVARKQHKIETVTHSHKKRGRPPGSTNKPVVHTLPVRRYRVNIANISWEEAQELMAKFGLIGIREEPGE